MKICKVLCATIMAGGFLLVLGASGGLEQGTMSMADASLYSFIGLILVGVSFFVYNKIGIKGDR